MLAIYPALPHNWRSLSFHVHWRGRLVAIRITEKSVEAMLVEGEPMDIRIASSILALKPGAAVKASL
jgi:trehalose/maltose hydrolase-like predicted phosphorylase